MSNKKHFKQLLSALVSSVLITAMALTFTGCQNKQEENPQSSAISSSSSQTSSSSAAENSEHSTSDASAADNSSAANADTSAAKQEQVKFIFKVVDKDGNEETFEISTDEKTVGAALLKEGLIEGEDSQYGLYVKKVNGITADYNVDGTYWAFYIGDEYAMTGVDSTDIKDGETYTFKVSK